jgi:uncharacterized protein (TIRG00374 family)
MRQATRGIFGLVLAAGLLWLLSRGTDWGEFRAAVRGVDWGWLMAAQAVAWASYFARIQRWAYVVRAAQPASFRHLLSATQIGFLVNFTVPARIGELVRAYLLSRFTGQTLPRSISMVAVDRVNDLTGLFAVMVIAVLTYDVNQDLEIAAGALGNTTPIEISSAVIRPATFTVFGLFVAAAAVLMFLHWRQSLMIRLTRTAFGWVSAGLAERLSEILRNFAEGLHIFRSRSDLAKAVFWSLLTWLANALSLTAIMLAFGLSSPWATSFLMLAFIAVSVSVPLAPGMVGQYHLPVVAALLLSYPGLEPAHAKAVAVVAHLSALVPITGLGFFCLQREGLGLLKVVRQATQPTLTTSGAAKVPTSAERQRS